ncbi:MULTISPECIES: hypothetical protein [Lentisalinibacter]|uniref:hypothetical protein n=1 Tax=Lentisalinibacter TaxID=3382081 RepID=UPI00386E5AE5
MIGQRRFTQRCVTLALLLTLLSFTSVSSAGIIQQLNESQLLQITEYRVKSIVVTDGVLTKTFSIIVSNSGADALRHVYLEIDSAPAYVSTSGRIYFAELEAGAMRESSATVTYSLNTDSHNAAQLELVWEIRAELNGEENVDEVAVAELLD